MKRGRRGHRRRDGGDESLLVGGPHAVEAAIGDPAGLIEVMVEHPAPRRAAALAERARAAGVAVRAVPQDSLDRMVGARSQGIAARILYRYADFDSLLADPGVLVFLDGVADPHNLGAIIRTAAAAGALGVVVPSRRAAGVTAVTMRVSAGTAATLPVARVTNLVRALEMAGEAGFWRIGLSQDAAGVLLPAGPEQRTGLVLGGEGSGLRPLVARTCDELVRLPMRGAVESLNVSVAAALALYRVCENALFGPGAG
ncbi:MAG: 23S rRNA (guanosine(2251)-2'-O)-methyltransferase RlmB [Deltaproteobacteria bacterium]|nr:MAG: 23S rRNA (guanosine(2251)-2'-O)-methyltransferase RlmB [Deltaproteobacteria bacterium]